MNPVRRALTAVRRVWNVVGIPVLLGFFVVMILTLPREWAVKQQLLLLTAGMVGGMIVLGLLLGWLSKRPRTYRFMGNTLLLVIMLPLLPLALLAMAARWVWHAIYNGWDMGSAILETLHRWCDTTEVPR